MPDEDISQVEAIEWGNRLESIVVSKFEEVTGKTVKTNIPMITHPAYPFMLANIDGDIKGENAGLEVKTCTEYKVSQWDDEEGRLSTVPDEYLLQCLHYLAVTEYDRWYIAVLIGGNKFRWGVIERQDYEDVIQEIIYVERIFWEDHVIKRVPPIAGENDAELLSKMHGVTQDESIKLDYVLKPKLDELVVLKGQKKSLESRQKQIENELKAAIGSYTSGECGGYLAKWPQYEKINLDAKSLKRDHPEIAEKYTTKSNYRRLTIKELEQ